MEKDYSKYFKPTFKEARKRSDTQTQWVDDYEIPNDMLNIGLGKTYHIRTYGCQANERDSEMMRGILEQMGYTSHEDASVADVVLLNTCAIRENAELKVFGKVGFFKNLKLENPDKIVGVCGCMAQEENIVERLLTKHRHIDLIFGTHNIHRLPQLLKDALFSKARVVEVWSKEGDIVENLPSVRASHIKAWVNIMYGCDKFCTYCIVPYTRGKERSRDVQDILEEVKMLVLSGYQEITLLGQNVNAYGKDNGGSVNFTQLLVLVAQTNIPRIRFSTSHPWDFNDEMIAVIAKYDNIMPYIHLPVQSGSNEVLKSMARKYTVESYIELFDKLKAAIPNCAFSTDIIVGFPNETDAQFEETLKLVTYCHFDNAYTFIYSPRVGTPAAKFIDNVPDTVKEARLQKLNLLVNKCASECNALYLNQVVEVLVEGPSKKNKSVLSGYTKTQKLVNFVGNESLIGQCVHVRIIEPRTWSLNGELVE